MILVQKCNLGECVERKSRQEMFLHRCSNQMLIIIGTLTFSHRKRRLDRIPKKETIWKHYRHKTQSPVWGARRVWQQAKNNVVLKFQSKVVQSQNLRLWLENQIESNESSTNQQAPDRKRKVVRKWQNTITADDECAGNHSFVVCLVFSGLPCWFSGWDVIFRERFRSG